jgi:tetratricopeptide (TPR) repeat protein
MRTMLDSSPWLVSLCLLCTLGCSEAPPATATNVSPAANPTTQPATQLPSDEECLAVAKQYEAVLATHDPQAISNFIDWSALFDSALATAPADTAKKAMFVNGLKKRAGNSVGQALVEAMQDGGSVQFLRVHEVQGEKRVLFRVVIPDQGLNYHDIVLTRNAHGKLRPTDIYVLLSGEKLSETMQRMFFMSMAGEPIFLEKLRGKKNEFAKHMPKFLKLMELFNQGKHQECLQFAKQLPTALSQEKTINLVLLHAAESIDDKVHAEQFSNFRQLFPNDACVNLISFNYFHLRQDYENALEATNRLDESLGGDPYLNLVRINVYLAQQKFDTAKQLIEKIIVDLPDSPDSPVLADLSEWSDIYWARIGVSLQEKNFADTVTWLNRITTQFKIELPDLRTEPEYAEFVQSPEFAAWQKP